MKTFFLFVGLIASVGFAHGQGTIAFGNSALTRCTICSGNQLRFATAADGLTFAVFYGPAGAGSFDLVQVQQPDPKATIGTTAGVMINAPSVFALPGTEPGQVVSLQIRAWDTATGGLRLRSQTDVRQVTLGQTAGPGTVIWQTATGTNPNRFYPMYIGPLTPPPECIPEPSILALGALAGLFPLFLRRKSTHK